MLVFPIPAVKTACGDRSAARQRPSAWSGQSLSAVLLLVLMAGRVHWACPCSGVCLMAMLPDALEKRQPLESAAASCGSPPYAAWPASPLGSGHGCPLGGTIGST